MARRKKRASKSVVTHCKIEKLEHDVEALYSKINKDIKNKNKKAKATNVRGMQLKNSKNSKRLYKSYDL